MLLSIFKRECKSTHFLPKFSFDKRLNLNQLKMIIFKKAADIHEFLHKRAETGASIGFVPTMGALHEGHISLVERSRKNDGLTVSSIFVNPTQFNDKKDFEKYPVTIECDIDMLEAAGCAALFLPELSEMYPQGMNTDQHYELGFLESILEGKYRPGHFQGVCQVVDRLLSVVYCNTMYLGQKDYQQCMVLKKLVDLKFPNVTVDIVPTMREADGLAMSSRNMRLDANARQQAVKISEALSFIKKNVHPGYLEDLKERVSQYLQTEGFKVDYVEIANANTIEAIEHYDGKTKLVALIAAFIGEVRLIDNMLIN